MIAEGNPDESTVGMFGVGFYSVNLVPSSSTVVRKANDQ
jgi:HSP90 family molecular chaperone